MAYTISKSRPPFTPREKVDPCDYLIRGWARKWEDWNAVINLHEIDDNWEERTGLGYRLKSNVVTDLFKSQTCGIYELMAKKNVRQAFVVYVGCSCQNRGQSVLQRINEYCADGSHKAQLINDALRKGYTLYFRYKPARSPEEAEDDENKLLVKYSYAWNVRTITGTLPD